MKHSGLQCIRHVEKMGGEEMQSEIFCSERYHLTSSSFQNLDWN